MDLEAELDAGKTIDQALTAIEPVDSDGDGHSNIDEINAGASPGDATDMPSPAPTPTAPPTPQQRSYDATAATIQVDGDISDWAAIPGLTVTMPQLVGDMPPIDVELKVALDSENIYVLFTVPDDYSFDPADHDKSAAIAVMFPIDPEAGPHMGTDGVNWNESLGMVDIWHWELDCGPGEVSGGVNRQEDGNDPACNLDDEWATTAFERHDDDLNNLLTGVWEHTGRAAGADAAGTWIFEMSRPLDTGDPQDAQFSPGESTAISLAYWAGDETPDGWTATGHFQSSDDDWIAINLGAAPAPTPTATPSPAPAAPAATPAAPVTGSGGLLADEQNTGINVGVLTLIALGGVIILGSGAWALLRARR